MRLWIPLFGLLLVGCGSSSTEIIPPLDIPVVKVTTIDVGVILSSSETNEMDPRTDGGFDSFINVEPPRPTYNFKNRLTIYDDEETFHQLDLYFILTSASSNTWEVRARLDSAALSAVDIDNSGNDRNDQNLSFDSEAHSMHLIHQTTVLFSTSGII